MKTEFRRSFLRDLKRVGNRSLLERVKNCIHEIEAASTPAEIAGLKKLQGFQSYYRIRIGDHRVGISIESDTVTFIRLLDRKDIYRYFT